MATDAAKPKVKDRILALLAKADKPMDFEGIYAALCEDGYPMPAEKPKLIIRKALYDAQAFTRGKDGFTLASADPGSKKPIATSAPTVKKKKTVSEKAPPPPKKEEPKKPPVPDNVPKLKDRLVNILCSADEPLPFEKIYSLLEKDDWPLPENKPKLSVRKALYDDKLFRIKGQAFAVAKGVKPTSPVTAPPASPAAAPAAVPVAVPVVPVATPLPSSPPSATPAAPVAVPAISAEDIAAKAAQAATEAAQQAAAQVAAEAASQAEATLEAAKAAREAAIEAAREAAKEAAKEAAEAARLAAQEAAKEAAAAAREAAQEAAKEAAEAARLAAAEATKEVVEAARRATEEAIATVRIQRPAPPPASEPAETSNRPKGSSIRERAKKVILEAGEPLSFDEVFADLSKDAYPLPEMNATQIVQRVLENEDLFMKTEDGLYVPYIEEDQELG